MEAGDRCMSFAYSMYGLGTGWKAFCVILTENQFFECVLIKSAVAMMH